MTLDACRYLRRVAAAVVLIACLPAPAAGQQATGRIQGSQYISADRGSTIAMLVADALERSPAVQAARARIDAARGDRVQANLRPNPSLMSEFREQAGGADRQTMVALSWPLDLFTRPGRLSVSDARIAQAEQEAADVERLVAASVRSKALQVLASVRQLEVRETLAATLGQFRDLVGARVQSGAAPPLERDLADVDARRSLAEVLRQRAAVESALAELRAVIGLAPDQPLRLRETLDQVAAASDMPARIPTTDSVARLIGERPDIRGAESFLKSRSAEVDLIRRQAKPEVSLNAGYMRMSAGFPLFGVDALGTRAPIHAVVHNLSVGAAVVLPWRNRRQGDIAAGSARVSAAALELETRRLTAGAEIAAATARVRSLDDALAVYAGGLRELAARNVEVVRQSYELGRSTLIDVLAETRRFLETETAYTDVLFDTMVARSDLAAAVGVVR
jgi:cobalt-zinc-cadmium efflux system outer membrane protein